MLWLGARCVLPRLLKVLEKVGVTSKSLFVGKVNQDEHEEDGANACHEQRGQDVAALARHEDEEKASDDGPERVATHRRCLPPAHVSSTQGGGGGAGDQKLDREANA